MLTLTKRLLKLCRLYPALSLGSYRTVNAGEEDCFCYLRQYEGQSFLIALNFSRMDRQISLPELRKGRGHCLLSTHFHYKVEEEVELTHLILKAEEGCLIRLGRQEAPPL